MGELWEFIKFLFRDADWYWIFLAVTGWGLVATIVLADVFGRW